jgi:hypothetical protein
MTVAMYVTSGVKVRTYAENCTKRTFMKLSTSSNIVRIIKLAGHIEWVRHRSAAAWLLGSQVVLCCPAQVEVSVTD